MLEMTIKEYKNVSANDKQLNTTDEQSRAEIFFSMLAFEDFFIRFAKDKINVLNPKITRQWNQVGE